MIKFHREKILHFTEKDTKNDNLDLNSESDEIDIENQND